MPTLLSLMGVGNCPRVLEKLILAARMLAAE